MQNTISPNVETCYDQNIKNDKLLDLYIIELGLCLESYDFGKCNSEYKTKVDNIKISTDGYTSCIKKLKPNNKPVSNIDYTIILLTVLIPAVLLSLLYKMIKKNKNENQEQRHMRKNRYDGFDPHEAL